MSDNDVLSSWEFSFATAGLSDERAEALFEHLLSAVEGFDADAFQETAGAMHRLGESSEVPAS